MNADTALAREWLVTNGLGGFAGATISQANTRRYHGLLIASLRPPVDRVLMVAKADVTASCRNGEIFDGAPPHTPRGCFAQAWSVSETLRAWHALAHAGMTGG